MLIAALFVSPHFGCAFPKPATSSPGAPRPGGGADEALQATAANLTQFRGNKKSPLTSQEVSFRCEVFLKNEPVSNIRLCKGIAFLVIDVFGKTLARLFPDEMGLFRYRGQFEAQYQIKVENEKQWQIEEKGPFFSGREYTLTTREKTSLRK